jgi:lipoyl(octanoyl) transferase
MEQGNRQCWLYNLGLVPYAIAWEWQKSLVQERLANPTGPDVLMLLEHPPVYTLGTGARSEFVKFTPRAEDELYRVERGGEVTYHCPGQLVGYPILHLCHYQQDLHWYLRQLEEVLLRVLGIYGLRAERLAGLTGVWVNGYKVGAIGIKVSRWVTMHGFALNVCPNLEGFQRIIPCGISDKPVGSLAQFIPGIDITEVRSSLITVFQEVFAVELVQPEKNLPEITKF